MLRSQWLSYVDQQSDELQNTHGVSFLPELGVLRFAGTDVRAFLQGYLTCDTLELQPDTLVPMAVCNLKGRVVVNGWCYLNAAASGEAIVLIVHRSLTQRLAQFFKAYLMFSKTELTDLSDAMLVFGTAGVSAQLTIDANQGLVVVSDLQTAKALTGTHPQLPAHAWWLAQIRARIPLISAATSEAFLPQMLDLERLGAVDFDKGCYLGQEVVARAQHRGEVKRRLQHLLWRGTALPEPGAQFGVSADPARHVGTVINSIATSDAAGECLAVVSNDAAGPFQYLGTGLSRAD